MNKTSASLFCSSVHQTLVQLVHQITAYYKHKTQIYNNAELCIIPSTISRIHLRSLYVRVGCYSSATCNCTIWFYVVSSFFKCRLKYWIYAFLLCSKCQLKNKMEVMELEKENKHEFWNYGDFCIHGQTEDGELAGLSETRDKQHLRKPRWRKCREAINRHQGEQENTEVIFPAPVLPLRHFLCSLSIPHSSIMWNGELILKRNIKYQLTF